MLKKPILILLAALSAACTSLPDVEFQAYRDAFQAAQAASAPMIADYAVAERSERLRAMRADGDRRFDDFFPGFVASDSAALSTIALPPGASAVDRAFRAIAAYNDTLASLAENRNIEEARGQLRQIVAEVGGIVPGSGPAQTVASGLSDVVLTLFAPAIEQQNRAQFRRILVEGHPKVVELIRLLREHTPFQYSTTTWELRERAQLDPPDRPALVSRINAWHRVFADYVALLDAMEGRLGTLVLAMQSARSAPLLARAAAGAADLRSYADALRISLAQLRAAP